MFSAPRVFFCWLLAVSANQVAFEVTPPDVMLEQAQYIKAGDIRKGIPLRTERSSVCPSWQGCPSLTCKNRRSVAPVPERNPFPVAEKEKRASDYWWTDETRHSDHASKRVEIRQKTRCLLRLFRVCKTTMARFRFLPSLQSIDVVLQS